MRITAPKNHLAVRKGHPAVRSGHIIAKTVI